MIPRTLRFMINSIISIAETYEKTTKEENFKKIFIYTLITNGLEPAIKRPYENGILGSCKLPSLFNEVKQVIEILKAAISGYQFPLTHPLWSANDFIKNSQ